MNKVCVFACVCLGVFACVCVSVCVFGVGGCNEGCFVTREVGLLFTSHPHERGTNVTVAAEF